MSVNGAAVRKLRERTGFTPKQLAEQVGISKQYMSDIELGTRTLKRRPDLIKKIAEALDVPQTWITTPAPGEAQVSA